MAFDYEAAWRKAEEVTFSREVVTADGRELPRYVKDGFGKVFRFNSAGTMFVTYQLLDDVNCFKLFTPDMVVRNMGRELFNVEPVGKK
jgi:hypothetical protein